MRNKKWPENLVYCVYWRLQVSSDALLKRTRRRMQLTRLLTLSVTRLTRLLMLLVTRLARLLTLLVMRLVRLLTLLVTRLPRLPAISSSAL
jgi:hypothetical protein